MKKDDVYAAPLQEVSDFSFDARVADVFENMINRSVPGYAFMLDLIGVVSTRYARPGTNCYDLGCSLGASTLMIRHHVPAGCHVIGIDNSVAMVERCRANVSRDHSEASVDIRQESIQETQFSNASVVVLNFTLQFIPPAERQQLLCDIHTGMIPGGALILAEKVSLSEEEAGASITSLHEDFKRYQGYSDLEIAQKRTALENVMIPDSIATHRRRLAQAGFTQTAELSRCLNFASLLAIA
ncbi:MAG: carboxy-S-adenosyl-L-methionine synthase CmoA [Pseudomonadota bacterium]